MSMVRIAVRVPQSLADELRVEGEAHGCDLSWAVRRRLSAGKSNDSHSPNKQAAHSKPSANSLRVLCAPQVSKEHGCQSSPQENDVQGVSQDGGVSRGCDSCGALIGHQKRQATDAQIKSEWARRTQAMRKSRKGGRPNLETPAQAAAPPNMESISTRDEYPRRMWPANEPPCSDCGALVGHQKWCKLKSR